MQFFKKEWKAFVVAVWMVIITILLLRVGGQLSQLQKRSVKMASTLDSVESITLSTDASVAQTAKRVGEIDANVSFITQKVRRR